MVEEMEFGAPGSRMKVLQQALKQAFKVVCVQKKAGVSLFETVIALGLMGMILIPMFLFSYSNFATILTKGRDRLAVGHEVSMAMHRMQTELSMTRQIFSTSTTTALYFTYYDPIQDAVVKRGYQLSANGSGRKLERLSYANGSWTATSPYPNSPATSYMLPAGAQFTYCSAANCSLSSNNQALSVRLSSWSFYRAATSGSGFTLTLPTLEFYLSSGQMPELILKEKVTQLYSTTTTNAFNATIDPLLLFLSPDGTKLNALTQDGSRVYRHDIMGSPIAGAVDLSGIQITTYSAACQDVYGNIFLMSADNRSSQHYHYNAGLNEFYSGTEMVWSSWASSIEACAPDQSNNSIALLDADNKQIDIYTNRYTNGTPSAPTSLSLASMTTPTGLALNGRTGDYLVLDSALQSNTYVRLFIVNSAGTVTNTINIDVTGSNLSVDATTETNFKIAFNDNHNLLYLIAPTLDRFYVLALDQYL